MRISQRHLRILLDEPLTALSAPMRRQRIVMFHVGRSGSTVLADLINQHWNICWRGEIYSRHLDAWSEEGAGLSTRSCQERLKAITTAELNKAGLFRSAGFEVKFFHLALAGVSVADYVGILDAIGVTRFIILERRNTLRKVVSSVIGHKERTFHLQDGQNAGIKRIELDTARVEIDYGSAELLSHLSAYEKGFSDLRTALAGRDVLDLSYEDDVSEGPLKGYRKVCAYLGARPRDVRVRYAKTNPFPLREIVTNWGAVAGALENTRFQWMLDE